jgi:hypothetical protein
MVIRSQIGHFKSGILLSTRGVQIRVSRIYVAYSPCNKSIPHEDPCRCDLGTVLTKHLVFSYCKQDRHLRLATVSHPITSHQASCAADGDLHRLSIYILNSGRHLQATDSYDKYVPNHPFFLVLLLFQASFLYVAYTCHMFFFSFLPPFFLFLSFFFFSAASRSPGHGSWIVTSGIICVRQEGPGRAGDGLLAGSRTLASRDL